SGRVGMAADRDNDWRRATGGPGLRPLGDRRRPDRPEGFLLEADRVTSPSRGSEGPRVAVVGAGAWGTTLAVLIGRQEPVTLVARDREAADAIETARENARRLPGIALPRAVRVTSDA